MKQASGRNSGGFKTSVNEASSAAAMLKTLKRLNQARGIHNRSFSKLSTFSFCCNCLDRQCCHYL